MEYVSKIIKRIFYKPLNDLPYKVVFNLQKHLEYIYVIKNRLFKEFVDNKNSTFENVLANVLSNETSDSGFVPTLSSVPSDEKSVTGSKSNIYVIDDSVLLKPNNVIIVDSDNDEKSNKTVPKKKKGMHHKSKSENCVPESKLRERKKVKSIEDLKKRSSVIRKISELNQSTSESSINKEKISDLKPHNSYDNNKIKSLSKSIDVDKLHKSPERKSVEDLLKKGKNKPSDKTNNTNTSELNNETLKVKLSNTIAEEKIFDRLDNECYKKNNLSKSHIQKPPLLRSEEKSRSASLTPKSSTDCKSDTNDELSNKISNLTIITDNSIDTDSESETPLDLIGDNYFDTVKAPTSSGSISLNDMQEDDNPEINISGYSSVHISDYTPNSNKEKEVVIIKNEYITELIYINDFDAIYNSIDKWIEFSQSLSESYSKSVLLHLYNSYLFNG